MEHDPRRVCTQTTGEKDGGTSSWVLFLDRSEYDEEHVAALYLKAEEYMRRIEASVSHKIVRDAICKLAILDLLLNGEGTLSYEDAYQHAMEGISLYGRELLVASVDEEIDTVHEFDQGFDVIEAYLRSGNEQVKEGSGLPVLGDL